MFRRLVIAAIALATSTLNTFAYPISPAPLWELTKRSQLVVLADVIAITKPGMADSEEKPDRKKPVDNIFRDATARLRIRETWKGNPVAALDVRFPDTLICPAPPRYVEGEVVIAFLFQNEGVWETTSLSYGTIYPRRDDVADFRRLVLEAVTLQVSTEVTHGNVIKWHVEAASHPGTRWHGLYFLVPESDKLHSYYDQGGKQNKAGRLTPTELKQIADAFVAAPPTDRTLPMTLAVLSEFPDDSVSLAAASAVEALLAEEPPPWWLRDAFAQIFRRYGGHEESEDRLRTLGQEFSEVDPFVQALGDDFSEVSAEQMRAVWEQARKALGIPKAPPAKVLEEEVWGVASNTPS